MNPSLTEPGVKYFFNGILKQCHSHKLEYHNAVFNICLFCLFIFVFGLILYFKYKGKLTAEQKEKKKQENKQYILTKLNNINASNNIRNESSIAYNNDNSNVTLITDLPSW
jgi:hypothetical protein